MTMNVNEMTKQVMDFQKGAFSSWCDTMAVMQDRTASVMEMMFSQAGWIPDKGRKVILSWLSACMKERDRFKIYVQDSSSNLEKYFSQDLTKTDTSAVDEKKAAAAINPKAAAAEEKKTPVVIKPDTAMVEERKAESAIKQKAAAAQKTKPSIQ